MGVPKFYRWTSERYPCLSQVVREHQIPEFDNLYFDMNGIIHVCSHPNDDDPHFRISEADIFKNIFHYIEVLFRIIKPKGSFFMAIDGVAPRAKMNQQRGRRFRTAKEAEDNIKRALQKGEQLPKEERFDSNCITPGTDFMARLNSHLQYFVNDKISSDPHWQNCDIYLSGHDVPGEGEHKIMDFIRYEKSKKDYDPNTRHCLYGLDADLIMLGLVSHEPHFSLLREEVRFGKQSKRVTKPEETVFHLLHLSLMREYLDFEFGELKDKLPYGYDLERIIDDWVLLGFLVGNDFIPHLPQLHINHDALPFLYKIYIETMPKLDGYLHDGGILNLPRFQKYLEALSKFDRDRFEDVYADMKWLEGRTGRSFSPNKRKGGNKGMKFSKLVSQVEEEIMIPVRNPYMALADVSDAFDDSAFDTSQRTLELESGNDEKLERLFGDLGFKDLDGGEELFDLEFRQHKRAYYVEKFEVPVADDGFISKVAFEYILAIQWNLHYYYNGIQSWSWYYPYHYAPYISDILNIQSFDLTLEKSKPFKPFEQLLAVLPSYSRKLLPDAFQSLMVNDTSPIIDYYPTQFKTDLNGKQQEWEAVVLIPFIDERRLLGAMATHYSRLTDEEKERNSFGKCLKYSYSKDLNFVFPSTYPGVFKDIAVCKAHCEQIDKDKFHIDIKFIKKGLSEGVQQDVYFPGFPTLKHIPHEAQLRKAGVRVFSYASKSKNTIISIEKEEEEIDVDVMRETVGSIVHVEWPYLVEALVTAITDGERRFILKQAENVVEEDKMTKAKIDDAFFWMKNVRTNLLERKGIDPGEVKVLVEAKTLKGKRYVCGPKGKVTLEKHWADTHTFYPLQAIIRDLKVHTSKYQKEAKSLDDLYKPGNSCFMMASPHYGCSGEVLEVDTDSSRVRVSLAVPPEPDFEDVINNQTKLSDRYFSLDAAARRVGLSSRLLSKITGNILVTKNSASMSESRTNIGLKLKFSGRNREVLGYARRDEEGWSFSENAIDVLCSYVQRFPELFKMLSNLPEQECYEQSILFPDQTWKDSVEEILTFLKSLAFRNTEAVKCGSKYLDEKIICAIGDAVEEAKSLRHQTKCVKVKVKPFVLFKPTADFGDLVPDPTTDYYLFDRVVNVRDDGAVPMGYRGTIVGVHEIEENKTSSDSPSVLKYEVLFDQPFLGGLQLRCKENKGAFMSSSSLLNISYGERKEMMKKGFTPKRLTGLQEKAQPRSLNQGAPSPYGESSPFSPQRRRNQSADNSSYERPRESTPKYTSRGGYTGRGYSRSGNRSKGDDDLKTPDYWLRGYGGRTKTDSSPRGNYSHRESPKTSRATNDDGPKYTILNKSESDGNFEEMWKKLQDSGKKDYVGTQEPKKDIQHDTKGNVALEQEKVNLEGTARLQKLLNIKAKTAQHAGDDSQRQASKEQQRVLDSTKPHGKLSADLPRIHANEIINKLFQSKSADQPPLNSPASPTSPLMPGTVSAPAKGLQQWCFESQMPAPQYTYSVTPQGVHAVVNVGPAICFGGLMCKSKAEAAESAAAIALGHLMHSHGPFPRGNQPFALNSPHMYMGHRPSVGLQLPGAPVPQQLSPRQFIGGASLRFRHDANSYQSPPSKPGSVQRANQPFPLNSPQLYMAHRPNAGLQHQGTGMHQQHSPLQLTRGSYAGSPSQSLQNQIMGPQPVPFLAQPVAIPANLARLANQQPSNISVSPQRQQIRSDQTETKNKMCPQEKESNTQTDTDESQLQESKASGTESSKASGPTFVPLQVNRAGMRANKSSADATLKDECLEPRKTEREEVNLIDFNIEIEKSKLPADFESVVPSESVESSSKKKDVVGNEGPVGAAKAEDFPSVPRKEKPRKKKFLAANFSAPKKQ
ncbi:5'-3' exoribonuclease 1-like [Rhopilema esculentum]|uniref:5'-3' exoribonuclease 1-like n=1 Tax=Rhopilema esculentum TaxID=499914 RepID=UPI0031D3960A